MTSLPPAPDPVAKPDAPPPTDCASSPVRELLTSRWLLGFLAAWAVAASWIVTGDRGVLPQSEQEPAGYFSGIAGATISITLLMWLARNTRPIDVREGPRFHNPRAETVGLLAWMSLVVGVGSLLDIRTHIAFVGLGDGSREIWDAQTPTSTLVWVAYNFVALAVVPYLFFRYRLGYDNASMLLRFPRGRVWVPYFAVIGALGFLPAVTSDYFSTPMTAHLLTAVLFTLGSFLPIMITTQSLLTPRLATLAGSWVTGAVWSALVYAALNITEIFLAWGSFDEALLSLAWVMQVSFWGLVKAITTLRTGNAWMHIATTHTIHLAEAPAVAHVFRIR
jgi:hypothetical protein